MRAVSFNVLADAYIGYGNYSHVRPELLEPGARSDAIVELLKNIDADVIGLQEVDEALANKLRATDTWQSFWTPKEHKKPDGCLMLVKQSIDADGFETHVFNDDSGHIAQLVKIGQVALVNTHIKWAPADSRDHIGVRQIGELLEMVDSDAVVLFADCNDRPGGPVRKILDHAGFINLCGETPTALVDQEPVAIDLLAVRGISGRNITRNYNLHQIPSTECPSDHIPIEADLDL